MTFALRHVGEARVITLEGEAGPAAVITLQRRIVRALDAGHRRIVVDLGAVSGLGGQTTSLLCGALRFVSRCGATLALAGGSSPLRRAVELSAIDGVELHLTVDAALTAPASRSPSRVTLHAEEGSLRRRSSPDGSSSPRRAAPPSRPPLPPSIRHDAGAADQPPDHRKDEER